MENRNIMDNKKSNNKSFEESSKKKLEEIIKQSKAENEALKKLLIGLEKLEEKTNMSDSAKNKSKNKK